MDKIEMWNSEIEKLMEKGMTRGEANRQLAIKNPELHQAYLAQYTEVYGRRGSANRDNR